MRKLLFAVWLYACVVVLGILWLPLLVSQRSALWGVMAWGRAVIWGLRTFVGVRIEIIGREHIPHGGALIAAKHQSMLDTIIPLLVLDAPVFVLKAELLKIPFYGWHSARAGMIPVDRDGHAQALKNLVRRSAQRISEGRQIIIFPEGTRRLPGAEPAYKPGIAALYRDLNVPCVPVALNTGLVWPQKGLPSKPGVVTFEFLPPIEPGLSRLEFMRTLQERIEGASQKLLTM